MHEHIHPHPHNFNKEFAIAVSINFLFSLIEAVYAILAHSMSLLADAGHNLGDVTGLLLAWGANVLLNYNGSLRYSYGFKKTTILASLANALLLVGTAAIIAYEAIYKFFHPSPVGAKIVMVMALIGIFINAGTAALFSKGQKEDLNIRGAFWHLLVDSVISFGVLITAILIAYTGKVILDPIVGLIIVVVILVGSWELIRDSINMVLDAVPHKVDINGVKRYLLNFPGVKAIHDLHIWGLSTREIALTAHLVVPDKYLLDEDYHAINETLWHRFHIHHVTLQVEKSDQDNHCKTNCET
jgi:cobalt-zinc-cadmium efflux system protein